jgi:hypothetical protein
MISGDDAALKVVDVAKNTIDPYWSDEFVAALKEYEETTK